MGILGIKNRTENWKTAQYFAPFFKDEVARLRLAKRLGEPNSTQADEVRLELYWQGMRDYIHLRSGSAPSSKDLADRYDHLFSGLRESIKNFGGFQLRGDSYRVSDKNRERLFNNLRNTEIDVVLETPNYLFVGEAKDESDLGADGDDLLVHQLIRQHITARILVDICKVEKKVRHFVVGNKCKIASLKNTRQVNFLKSQGWLPERNVLSWGDIKELARTSSSSRRC